jgi:hypothetical protein
MRGKTEGGQACAARAEEVPRGVSGQQAVFLMGAVEAAGFDKHTPLAAPRLDKQAESARVCMGILCCPTTQQSLHRPGCMGSVWQPRAYRPHLLMCR